jgi:uncharacterized protein YeaO (DUF488 family)
MAMHIKRIYDGVDRRDGLRVLIDRLWPRGVSKASAQIDLWIKDVAPSAKLRSWFHEDKVGRLKDFSKLYARELQGNGQVTVLKKALRGKSTATLVTAVKDFDYSHIPTLLKQLKR